MSLLLDAMTGCTRKIKATESDGYGGFTAIWTDGETFDAAIVLNSSMEIRPGEAKDVKAEYTITTTRDVTLLYHDVFKRNSDGKIFRVTSDGTDKYTPAVATLNMRQVSAEEWRLPE